MKKAFFIIALITFSSSIMAQSIQEEVDMVQSLFGMEKKAVVAEFIQLEGVQGDTFWALYDEYEIKRKELGKGRLALLQVYADTYDSMDDATADGILKDMMTLQISNDKLISTYAKKIKKKVNVKTAAQFYQIEGYVLSKIRAEILENIPVIGSMETM
jgi:hypothetical protein